MKNSIIVLAVVAVLALSTCHAADDQTVTRADTRPSVQGPSDWFTGSVRIDPLFPVIDGIPATGGLVTFEPGARSYWHTHPTGQQLVIVSGVGRTGTWEGKVDEVRVGDVVTCPAGVKHWHGASPTIAMTHLAITGTVDGRNVDWLEPVSDEQYNNVRE
ncbi:MAG: cupin domain-containing protein [Planctomycetes bacterium]|nr:cupin domain-containing protein [Planctomycetota bacterium]